MDIRLLDCTLRDGGYINDWNFGLNTTISVIERLVEANMDVIEIGFLDERQPFNIERTIQPDTSCYDKILAGIDRKNSMLVAMIDYGTCGLDKIAPCKESLLDGIRVIFKLPKMREAVAFGRELTKLGYAVFLQMVSITSYSDRDVLDFVDLVNEEPPYGVSMVDTYGLLHKDELLHYFHLLDYNLHPSIRIGYHSHNNFQLAYANTCEVIKRKARHAIVVDGTLYGMGKSAGNAPVELIAMYLNENYGKNYDISQLLEAIDTNIMNIYREKYWGYNLLYFLAASNDCHPSYISYLLDKKTLSVKAINEIVAQIPHNKKLDYDKVCIKQLYTRYQKQYLHGAHSIHALKSALEGKKVLLLGPGKTVVEYREQIDEYIAQNEPVVITTNFVPKYYNAQYIFISNAKRYSMLSTAFKRMENHIGVIATSNVTPVGDSFDYVLDYEQLLVDDHRIEDNSVVMLLKALSQCGPEKVVLAGFDGYSKESKKNYYSDFMEFSFDYEYLAEVNTAVKEILPKLCEGLDISFLTPSAYHSDEV